MNLQKKNNFREHTIYDNLRQINIGIDIVRINRFTKIPYSTHRKFYEKIFTLSEIKYCLKFSNPSVHFAGKFAIKEAIKKSIPDKITMLSIKTGHSKSKPLVSVDGKQYHFFVSVSHENNLAVAVVISLAKSNKVQV